MARKRKKARKNPYNIPGITRPMPGVRPAARPMMKGRPRPVPPGTHGGPRPNPLHYGGAILVTVEQDRYGSIILTPRNETLRKALAKHNKHWSGHATSTLYFQNDYDAEALLQDLPAATRREISKGWGATIKMSAYNFLMAAGYDAAEAIRQDKSGRWYWTK